MSHQTSNQTISKNCELNFACEPCRAKFLTLEAKREHDKATHGPRRRNFGGSKHLRKALGPEVPDLEDLE